MSWDIPNASGVVLSVGESHSLRVYPDCATSTTLRFTGLPVSIATDTWEPAAIPAAWAQEVPLYLAPSLLSFASVSR
jgi:hypothetical protein